MSFSWWCKGRDGGDLFALHEIHPQALNLPNSDMVRKLWTEIPYKESSEMAARDAIMAIQSHLSRWVTDRIHTDCDTCRCVRSVTTDEAAAVARLLHIEATDVWRAGGGW